VSEIAGQEGRSRTSTTVFAVAAAASGLAFVALVVLRAPEPLGLDQGLFACFGRFVPEGWVPYRDVFDHKAPAVFYTYALADLLFGRAPGGVFVLEAFALAAMLVVGGILGARLGDRWTGLATALFLLAGLWSPAWGGYWSRAQPEEWLALPLLGAAWIALRGEDRRAALFAGLLVGLAGSFKLAALVVAVAWPCYWIARHGARAAVPRSLVFAFGAALPLVMAALYFVAVGAGAEAWEAVFGYKTAYLAVSRDAVPWTTALVAVPRELAIRLPFALITGAIGLGVFAARRDPRGVLVGVWLLAAAAAVVVQYQSPNYHFLLIVPPLALAAGTGLVSLVLALGAPRRVLRVAAALALLVAVPSAVGTAGTWWRELAPHRALISGEITREDFLGRLRRGTFRPDVEEAISRLVAMRTRPGERLLVWGLAPAVYVLADRPPATRFPFHHVFLTDAPLSTSWGDLDARREAFLRRFDASPPALVLVGRNDANPFEPQASTVQMLRFEPFARRLRESYEQTRSTPWFVVYERRQGR
jgi:hypothetical protein